MGFGRRPRRGGGGGLASWRGGEGREREGEGTSPVSRGIGCGCGSRQGALLCVRRRVRCDLACAGRLTIEDAVEL